MNETDVLMKFLQMPLGRTREVFERFATIKKDRMIWRNNGNQEQFLYIPGKRKDKVVLVAHADTVWYGITDSHTLFCDDKIIKSREPYLGIGADDRAGCAIVWLLRNSGHSILITDGEEDSGIGSKWIRIHHQDLFEELNQHQFMVEFDRKNSSDYKCYGTETPAFKRFIEDSTGYHFCADGSYTDICTLCRDLCGVNFSIGYYNGHSPEEYINIHEWHNTLTMANKFLRMPLEKFMRNHKTKEMI